LAYTSNALLALNFLAQLSELGGAIAPISPLATRLLWDEG